MAKLTLTHPELFALWTHAAHEERAPAYEIERDTAGVLYLYRANHSLKRLTPAGAPLPRTTGGTTNGPS